MKISLKKNNHQAYQNLRTDTMQTEQDLPAIPTNSMKSIPGSPDKEDSFVLKLIKVQSEKKQNNMETSFGIDIQNKKKNSKNSDESQQNQQDKQNLFFQPQKKNYKIKTDFFSQKTTQNQSSQSISTNQLQILAPLKKQHNTSFLRKQLRNNMFYLDRKFYTEALSFIETLGYVQSPDFNYIEQKSQICRLIFALIQLYTKPVDIEKEQSLQANLEQCKKLYKKLQDRKTIAIVKKYIKMEGQTLNYKLGKIMLSVGVDSNLINRSINNKKFAQIVINLYLLQLMNQLESMKILSLQVLKFIRRIHMDNQMRSERLKYFATAKRIIELGLLCCNDEHHASLSATLKILNNFEKDFSLNISAAPIIHSYFYTFFSEIVYQNRQINSYPLNSQVKQLMGQHSICSICLGSIDKSNNGFQMKENENYVHSQCEEFVRLVQRQNIARQVS